MTRDQTLTRLSLALILLLSFHFTDDAIRPSRFGTGEAGPFNLIVVAMLFLVLVGALHLAGRPAGYLVNLIIGLGSAAMPVLHLQHPVDWSKNTHPFFFLWTMIALGVLGLYMVVLTVTVLVKRGQSVVPAEPPR